MAAKDVRSLEEINREIAEVQLETAQINLQESRRRNEEFKQKEVQRHARNKQRMADLKQERDMHLSNQKTCAHMSGGEAGTSPLEGGGKFAFAVLSVAVMPDGATELIQCPRCRLKLYGRSRPRAEEKRMEAVAKKEGDGSMAMMIWENHLWWKELRVLAKKEGIPHNTMRGPTFMFTNADGINFIPQMR